MNAQQIYIAIAIVVLVVIAGLMVFTKRKRPKAKLSPLAGLAFAFVVAGIIFGDSRLIGYSLIGIGVLLSLIDIVKKKKK